VVDTHAEALLAASESYIEQLRVSRTGQGLIAQGVPPQKVYGT
jgi:hypothetical protein